MSIKEALLNINFYFLFKSQKMKFYIFTALLALSSALISAAPTENRLSKQIAFKLIRDKIINSDEEDTTSIISAITKTCLKCIEENLHTSLDVEVTEEDEEEYIINYKKYEEDMLTFFMAAILCPPGRTQVFKETFVNFAAKNHTSTLKKMNCKPGCYQNQLKELDPESVLVADTQPEENCAECIKETDEYLDIKYYSVKHLREVCQKPLFDMFKTNCYSVIMLSLGNVSDEVKQTTLERLNANSLEVTKNTLDCLVNIGE
jgi:hypothetical protein